MKMNKQINIRSRASTFTLFLLISLSSITASSQTEKLEKRISIVSKKQSLAKVLSEIEQKALINFSYSNQQIDTEQKISIVARNKTVRDILIQLFNNLNIEYSLVEKQLILKNKITKQKDNEVNIENEEKYTLSGYLKDKETGEALIGATVVTANRLIGTITNSYGFYSISLPKGLYQFNFSFIGYKSIRQDIKLNKNIELSQELELDATDLEVIVISAEDREDILSVNPLKKIDLRPLSQNLKKGISGENDLFQSIQTIPGMQSVSDGSVFFFTRGGNKDQNLILVDEAPVYNPAHLFGLISAVSPEAINDVSIYKNYFPVQYGGRLSSIVDVRIKDGNMNNFGFYGTINPITTSLNFEGPIIKQKASYHLSIRNSHVNWLNDLFSSNQDFEFIDIHAKVNFRMGARNRLYFSFYTGIDNIKQVETGSNSYAMKWQNFASTLRWNHLFSERLFSNTMLYTSYYDYYLFTSVENNQYWNSLIGNISLKSDYTFYANTKNTIKFGAAINSHYFNPGNLNDEYFTQQVKASGALQLNLYWGQDLRPTDKISISYGLRMLRWNNIGPTTIYSFNEYNQPSDTINYPEGIFNSFMHFEPRFELIYSINPINSVQLSYNHNVQHLHLLSNSISPFTTLDIWMPSGPNIQPQKMHQFAIGYYSKLTEFEFSVQGYYKKMLNQIEYAENANMLLNPYIESELRFGESNSYGIEFNLKKQKGNLTGYISYCYSQTSNEFNDVNGGRSYHPYYDKPHQINASLSYKFNDRLNMNANWIYSSGTRFSEPSGFYSYNSYQIPVYTEKNNAKLPDYHRLDASVTFRLNKYEHAKYSHQLSFTLINLYGRKNPIAINFNKIQNGNETYAVPANYITENQILPTKMYLFGAVPLISYKFNFQNKE